MAGSFPGRWPVLAVLGLAALLTGCGDSQRADDALATVGTASAAGIVSPDEMLSGADVPTLDPHTMNDAEIDKVAGAGPLCLFRYTRAGGPVLAFAPPGAAGTGVVKLNGSLVGLSAATAADGTILVRDGPLSFALAPEGDPAAASAPVEANMVFEVEDRLRVGYGGWLGCG